MRLGALRWWCLNRVKKFSCLLVPFRGNPPPLRGAARSAHPGAGTTLHGNPPAMPEPTYHATPVWFPVVLSQFTADAPVGDRFPFSGNLPRRRQLLDEGHQRQLGGT